MAMRELTSPGLTSIHSSIRSFARLAAGVSILCAAAMLLVGCTHKSADDYLKSGDQAMQSSGFSQAEADYQQAVKLAPDDARAHVALATAYLAEKKNDEAKAELMKALQLDPRNAAAHAAFGDLYLAAGDNGVAEEQYRAAVALDPGNAAYRIKLAQPLTRESKFAAAEVANYGQGRDKVAYVAIVCEDHPAAPLVRRNSQNSSTVRITFTGPVQHCCTVASCASGCQRPKIIPSDETHSHCRSIIHFRNASSTSALRKTFRKPLSMPSVPRS